MSAYFDTGVIAKWYVPEPGSAAAVALRTRFNPPAALTPLHRLELLTAWQLKVFRGEIAAVAAGMAAGDLPPRSSSAKPTSSPPMRDRRRSRQRHG